MSWLRLNRKFFVHQHDSMQCGAACLAMICNWYHRPISLSRVEDLIQPTPQGVSFSALQNAGKILNLESKALKLSLQDLIVIGCPVILHWNQNHFVLLYDIAKNGGKFYMADPSKGCYSIEKESFIRGWISTCSQGIEKGFALYFKPDENFKTISAQEKKSKRTFGFLKEYLNRFKASILLIILCLGLGCLLQLIMPLLTQWIVDKGIKNKDLNLIRLILLGELCILVGRVITDIIRQWLILNISLRINFSLISDFFVKLMKLPMKFFETKNLGDLLQRMGDHSRIQNFITDQTLSLIFSIMCLIVYSGVLCLYNIYIFIVFLGFSVLYIVWILIFMDQRKKLDYDTFEVQALSHNYSYQFLTTIQEIKIQGCGQRRKEEWDNAQGLLFELKKRNFKLHQIKSTGSLFLMELKNILIVVISANSVIKGEMSLGEMMAIQYIIGQLNSPLFQMIEYVNIIQDLMISLSRINDVHGRKNENQSNLKVQLTNLDSISFSHVDFRYDTNSSSKILRDITFTLERGKTTAIVGNSGCGKTTLLKLILGYYPIEKGEINISGISIDDIDKDWWRSQCGIVMQDGVIFNESIAANIAVSDQLIDMTKVKEAAIMACIDDFIQSLPMKYDTRIGKSGLSLSMGQKQRILIARAWYKNPQFVFLDEATNSLDTINEKKIVKNLSHFFKNRTVFIIAHRLSTIKNADLIIVMEDGEIRESGNHQELLNRKGKYYELVKNQLEHLKN